MPTHEPQDYHTSRVHCHYAVFIYYYHFTLFADIVAGNTTVYAHQRNR
jgi:hypothetical protein